MASGRTLRQPWNLLVLGVREMTAPLRNRVFGTAGPFGCRPININIEITDRCCLRCQMCNIWQSHPDDELTVEEWVQVLDSLKRWVGAFRLTVTGGEPFLKAGIWEFLDYCVGLAVPVVVITNGYSLTEKNLQRLVALPLAQVIFSLDSLSPAVHDRVRGVPGAFERTWANLSFLAKQRRSFILATNTVISGENILELGQMVSNLGESGIDRAHFQPVQRNIAAEPRSTWPYDTPLWPSSPDHVERGIRSLLEAKANGAPVAHSTEEILFFRDYFLQGPQWVRQLPCSVLFTTFHCDASGQVRMCVPYGGSIGNVRTHHPAEIWNSPAAVTERRVISSCRRACLLNCSRKYDLHAVAEKMRYGAIWLCRWGQPSRPK